MSLKSRLLFVMCSSISKIFIFKFEKAKKFNNIHMWPFVCLWIPCRRSTLLKGWKDLISGKVQVSRCFSISGIWYSGEHKDIYFFFLSSSFQQWLLGADHWIFFSFLCFLFHFSHQPTVMFLYWMGQFKLQREMSVLIKKWLHTYHFAPFRILRRYSAACRIINSFLLRFLRH